MQPSRAPPAPSLLASVLRLAWRRYLGSLRAAPLLTKSVTSGALSALSSLLAARLSRRPARASAALHELTIGLVLRGPLVHAFHTLLDGAVFARARDHAAPRVVLAKLALDQALFAPALTCAYLYLSAALEDVPVAVTTRKIRRELWSIMKSNWGVWVPANLIGYGVVPLELRVAWASLIGVLWTTFLICKVGEKPDEPAEVEGAPSSSDPTA
jgi:hypothetical protein